MRNHVLFVCEGKQHSALAATLAQSLAGSGLVPSLFYPHATSGLDYIDVFANVISDNLALPGFLQRVGLVVFFTHESSPFCITSIRVGFLARMTHTPCVTVQHGWIQPGFNFQTGTQKVAFVGGDTDNSAAIFHFSDVIPYFGEEGIGYPLFTRETAMRTKFSDTRTNVLITTNFNWGVYSRPAIVAFINSLRHLRIAFASFVFRHKPHPAEANQDISKEIGLYLSELEIGGFPWSGLDEALAWADMIITTPSTTFLDALSRGRPAFVFAPAIFGEALDRLHAVSFARSEELINNVTKLVVAGVYETPEIPLFNPARFVEAVNTRFLRDPHYPLTEEAFLRYLAFVKI